MTAGRLRSPDHRHSRPGSSNCWASILADLAEELQVMSRETSPLHVLKARLAEEIG
jgi:hypothetical protein